MPASQAQLGYGSVLGRRAGTLTTIAAAITANAAPQAVTPASMTSITVGTLLAIDTGNPALTEVVEVTAAPGPTFTAIFNNSHGTAINIALMVPLLEVVKFGGPGMKADMKEATNMGSPSAYKEFIAGLREGGEVTFEGNYIPKESTSSQANLRTDFEGGTVSHWCLALPLAGSGIWMFDGMVLSIAPTVPLDDRITFTAAIRVTGKPILF